MLLGPLLAARAQGTDDAAEESFRETFPDLANENDRQCIERLKAFGPDAFRSMGFDPDTWDPAEAVPIEEKARITSRASEFRRLNRIGAHQTPEGEPIPTDPDKWAEEQIEMLAARVPRPTHPSGVLWPGYLFQPENYKLMWKAGVGKERDPIVRARKERLLRQAAQEQRAEVAARERKKGGDAVPEALEPASPKGGGINVQKLAHRIGAMFVPALVWVLYGLRIAQLLRRRSAAGSLSAWEKIELVAGIALCGWLGYVGVTI